MSTASPPAYVTNANSKTLHFDSGARGSWRGAATAVTACGRHLENFASAPTPDADTRVCGQCSRRRAPASPGTSNAVQ